MDADICLQIEANQESQNQKADLKDFGLDQMNRLRLILISINT